MPKGIYSRWFSNLWREIQDFIMNLGSQNQEQNQNIDELTPLIKQMRTIARAADAVADRAEDLQDKMRRTEGVDVSALTQFSSTMQIAHKQAH